MQASRTWGVVFAIALLGAVPCHAVLIASGDGTGNTSAPADDPGWANVGTRTTGLTVIYLGNGWVLTANHVGAGDVILAGQTYSAISGSEHQLVNPDSTQADLLLFQINGLPSLPFLPIATTPPTTTSVATEIGAGLNRGAATSWNGINGFFWGSGTTMRWGTAPVSQVGLDISLGGTVTRTFVTEFTDVGVTPFPAQAAEGDSGGAAFVKVNGSWMLAGVLDAIDDYNGQPAGTALFGNHTYAADLSFYRNQIVPLVTPGCGLGAELVPILPLLVWLRGRRHRRRA
ncbi:MAG TPA: trypsin-like serine protease [Myxococcota bacterium]|nr:trypsin-like serine protease [Myxococcota bacterium]